MTGTSKNISFKNSLNLGRHSLNGIMGSLHFTMVSAAFHNVLVRKLHVSVHSYNYTSVEAFLPGSRVPRQFKYRTTESSITLELPNRHNLLGFIYSLVLAPVSGMKKGATATTINCRCDLGQGESKFTSLNIDLTELKSDHVYVWYDPFYCDNILQDYEPEVCFKFWVTNDWFENRGDVEGCIKECGVRLVTVEELHSVLPQLELDSDMEMDLKKGVELESGHTSIETSYYEKENDGLINHSSDRIQGYDTEPKSTKVKPESVEKDNRSKNHFSYVDNRIGSAGNETKTNPGPSREENITNFTDVLKSRGNEENGFEGKSIENTHDWQDYFVETKHYSQEGNPNLQGEQIIVSDVNDLIIKEPEKEKENAPIMDLCKPESEEGGSDGDPFAELESILLRSPESSSKATCSTSDVANIREALHNLEYLMENSLESFHGNIELRRILHMSLECIKQTSLETISPNVPRLVDSMTSSIENLFKDFDLAKKVVQEHISHLKQKEKLMQRVSDARKRKESMEDEKSRCEDKVGCLEEEAKMLDENIRILVERKKNVELENGKMKQRMERCEGEKKKVDDEVKNMKPESIELMSVIKDSTSSYKAALQNQQKLHNIWEGFKADFANNRGS